MTPKFKGVADAMKRLAHELDADSENLLNAIDQIHNKRKTVFAKAKDRVASAQADLVAVDGYLDQIDASNGAPAGSGPLPDSARSETSSKAFLDLNKGG